MQNTRSTRAAFAFAALTLGLAACDQDGLGPDSPAAAAFGGSGIRFAAAPLEVASPVDAAELSAAESGARSLAVALRSPEVRQEIKGALAASAVRENKLHFASFMQGRGGRILAVGQSNGGLSPRAFADAVGSVRRLELYMPAAAHRAVWTGGDEVLVGVQLDEDAPVVAFTPAGERMVLGLAAAPSRPVIMLVAAETDFRAQAAANERGQAEIACTVAAGETLEKAAQKCRAGVPAGPARNMLLQMDPYTTGLYATYMSVGDYEEPWPRGEPELELHAFGKRSAADGSARVLQCSSEGAATVNYQPGIRDQAYVFEMNNLTWRGKVMALNKAQLDTAQTAVYEGWNLALWEDDDTPCKVEQEESSTYFKKAITATSSIVQGYVAIFVLKDADYMVAARSFGSAASDIYDLLAGGDDLIGLFVERQKTTVDPGYKPEATHILYRETSVRGGATLIYE